jgi:enoyl-CoA hydratase/carnithine racemase
MLYTGKRVDGEEAARIGRCDRLVPLADLRAALAREKAEQDRLVKTEDWGEGVRASAERREPEFVGR